MKPTLEPIFQQLSEFRTQTKPTSLGVTLTGKLIKQVTNEVDVTARIRDKYVWHDYM